MTLDDYLSSPDFQIYQDETLRDEAVRAVEIILSKSSAVKRHQIYSIPGVIKGAGFKGLVELARKQGEKNTNSQNRVFWIAINDLLSKTATSEISLFHSVKSMLLQRGFIENEDAVQEKKAQKQLRKRNNDLVDIVMNRIIGVYFEHFNCHYFFFKSLQGGSR